MEEFFNEALGEALCKLNPAWDLESVKVEQTGTLKPNNSLRPDILIDTPGNPVLVLETSYDERDADRDARNRLGRIVRDSQQKILSAIAVHIPEELRAIRRAREIEARLLDGHGLRYALHQSEPDRTVGNGTRRWPGTGMLDGTSGDLARFADAAAAPRTLLERAGDEVGGLVLAAANRLGVLDEDHLEQVQKKILQRSPTTALRTTMILWLNALLTQKRLVRQGLHDDGPLILSLGGGGGFCLRRY